MKLKTSPKNSILLLQHLRGQIHVRPASTLNPSSSKPTTTKEQGDISSVFPSLSGKQFEPLPERFRELKRKLFGEGLRESWTRLGKDLSAEVSRVAGVGSQSIPSIEYGKIERGEVTEGEVEKIRRAGCVVIRNVIPSRLALEYKAQAREYIADNKARVRAFPPDDPAVYELYWTPSQVQARAHPNMLSTQTFLTKNLWHSSDPGSEISTTYPLTYADRFRIRNPGDAKFALGPHTDGGSLERWEDPVYRGVYERILEGRWEDYDPFDAKCRIEAKMDLYNGAGACSMFRGWQGWLSLSQTGPGEGTLKLCPMLKHATAYTILRPFFTKEAGEFDTDFPGSVRGACQEYDNITHPGLNLEKTMVSVPRVEPGDYVAWHCDMIHSVDKEHHGTSDSSVLYIPTCPMTKQNVEFLVRQREAAVRYSPPPDFPGAGGEGELGFKGAVDWNRVDVDGLRAMGMGTKRWEITEGMTKGEKTVIEEANRLCFGSG